MNWIVTKYKGEWAIYDKESKAYVLFGSKKIMTERAKELNSTDVKKHGKGTTITSSVKEGDILYANTGVAIKVLKYDSKFGGRILVERADGIKGGKPLWKPLSKFSKNNPYPTTKLAKGSTIKGVDIKVGEGFKLPNGEVIEIKRLFKENIDEDWVEYTRDGEKRENSLSQLRIFLNNWKAEIMKYGKGGGVIEFIKLKFNSHKNHNPNCDILEGHIDKDTFITYGVYVKGDKIGEEFMEYYKGSNYVVDSKQKSLSKRYDKEKIPTKYKSSWDTLKEIYNEKYFRDKFNLGGNMPKSFEYSIGGL
jgi:hypothetical protein